MTTSQLIGSDRRRTGRRGSLDEQLAPVRRAVLDDARAEATAILDEARARASEIVATADREAEEAVAAARRRAAAAARARTRARVAHVRREAHTAVLSTEAELRDELARRVRRALGRLPQDPRYPALLDALERLAVEQLGEGAQVDRDPASGPGVVATDGHRRVDYRLDALADRALTTVEEEVAALWD